MSDDPRPPIRLQKRNQYEYAFRLLVADFMRVCEFIEPVDGHLDVHSHRLYELLLRGCTEFESICREVLAEMKYVRPKPGDFNICDFAHVEPELKFAEQFAVLAFWRPEPAYLSPFAAWGPAQPYLDWYRAYNAVKHNRNSGFANASLRNVRSCIAGVFILVARLGVIWSDGRHQQLPGSAYQGEYSYEGLPFRLPYQSLLG
jgi:hypothetical protein